MNRWIFILPVGVLAVLIAIFAARLQDLGEGAQVTDIPSVLLDRPAPDFDLIALAERERILKPQDLRGQVSLLNIWGSWCVACLAEHPLFMVIKERHPDIPIFGLAWRDTPVAAAQWLTKHGDPFALTGLDTESRAAIAFGVTGAPETFVIDHKGVIRYKYTGPITAEDWTGELLPMIRHLQSLISAEAVGS